MSSSGSGSPAVWVEIDVRYGELARRLSELVSQLNAVLEQAVIEGLYFFDVGVISPSEYARLDVCGSARHHVYVKWPGVATPVFANGPVVPQVATEEPVGSPMALDVSLERTRALHRVWRALNDGDCPSCHEFHAATEILRTEVQIECPSCGFSVRVAEIKEIERMFAPAMDAAVSIFHEWRAERAAAEF